MLWLREEDVKEIKSIEDLEKKQIEATEHWNEERETLEKIIFTTYFQFCRTVGLKDKEDVSADYYIIKTIVKRCIMDFQKLSIRHENIKKTDCHKKAGYLTYWICKLSPINILNDKPYKISVSGKPILGRYINQIFAVLISMTAINAEKKEREEKNIKLNNKKLAWDDIKPISIDYIYELKYCNNNPDLISMICYYFDTNAGQVISSLPLASGE